MDLTGYELEGLRDDGDFSLYRARRPGSSASVLALVAARSEPRTVARLEREYALAPLLDLRWAARPLALGRYQSQPTLVLDDNGYDPLDRQLGRPLDIRRFLRLALHLSGAIAQVHRAGLIHKDIKPANVLVDADDHVRLTGFGIASQLLQERQPPAPPEVIAGTFAYMAPEQTGRMNRSIDARSDLYSLGVTLYEMLTGSLPFVASDAMEWIHCHIARRPPAPGERIDGVPSPVEHIVLKLLAKTAEDRYQTAAGVEADLATCLREWDAHGRIAPFSAGLRDVSERLLIPERLYGREAQIEALVRAFDRVVAGGTTEVVLVSGYSGIGKSSVVNELHKVLVPPRGLFAVGKVDQYLRDTPYLTLAQAFQSLVRELLGKRDDEVAQWRRDLLDALGPNAELMVNLIPELALIIGEPPPVPVLPPRDAQHRFQLVFRRFLGVFARAEHPLALFVDDLQWLDIATLDLIEHLATHPEVRHLLLVGAYRDNEVGPSHPLVQKLASIRRAGARVAETVLEPLTVDNVEALVADSFHCDSETARPLAQLVHQKAGGNPFFSIQFLMALIEEKLLGFDRRAGTWAWDLPRIRAKGYTENIADLMAAKLGRQAKTTQDALSQLACLGNGADVATLTLLQGGTDDESHARLWDAVVAGLVFRVETTYQFVHDRVHEAAYALIPEADRAAAHLRIGRVLVAQTPADKLEDRIFDIVSHLNRGVALITAQEERERVIDLNVTAGRRAKYSTAYLSARNHFAQAAALLAPDAWARCYRQTFDLYLELSECEYLMGSFEAADAMFDRLLGQGASKLDRAKVYSLRIKLYQVAGKYAEGMAIAMGALNDFGVTLPESDDDVQAAVDAEFHAMPVHLNGRAIAEMCDAAAVADPTMQAIINLLVDAVPCAYIGRPAFFPLTTLKAINLSIRHGNTDQSSFAYGVYAVWLVSVIGDISSAFQFSALSLKLNEKLGNARLRGTLLHLHADHVNFWRHHFATGLPMLERAFQSCLEVGDYVYGGFLAFETIWQLIEKGDTLDEIQAQSVKYATFARQSHNHAVYEAIRVQQQFVASLQGKSTHALRLGDSTFDEAESVATMVKATFGSGIAFYWITRQILAFLNGEYAEALDAARQAEPDLAAVMSMPIEATFYLFHVLTLTALYPAASAAQQVEYKRIIGVKLAKFELWTDNCAENFGSRHALVLAEIARIEGRDADALGLYERAIGSAREHGFVHIQALANELAAKFYADRGIETAADTYLRNARTCYLRWGAMGKVRQLDQLHARLREDRSSRDESTMATSDEQLDLGTVVKVSQAIFSEIGLHAFVRKLMVLALESAGADRGVLILPRDDEWWVEAEATTTDDAVEVQTTHARVAADTLPESILRYVIRTGESVLLDDAADHGPFSGDAYIQRCGSRSILCLPLIKQAKLIGVLYVENTLTPRAFAPARIAVLRLLASQSAISLENARLYADLQRVQMDFAHAARISMLGELTASIAHELRQPLAAISMNGQAGLRWLSAAAPNIDEARATSKRIVDDARHAGDIIGRIRAMAVRRAPERTLVCLDELIDESLVFLRHEVHTHGIAVTHKRVPSAPKVLGDRIQFQQVIVNLAVNAIQAIEQASLARREITIEVAQAETGRLRCAIEDSGPGIAREHLDTLFDTFFTTKENGMGMGLPICRSIIEAHGGSIAADNRSVHGGARFFFTLPLADAGG